MLAKSHFLPQALNLLLLLVVVADKLPVFALLSLQLALQFAHVLGQLAELVFQSLFCCGQLCIGILDRFQLEFELVEALVCQHLAGLRVRMGRVAAHQLGPLFLEHLVLIGQGFQELIFALQLLLTVVIEALELQLNGDCLLKFSLQGEIVL